QQECVEWRIWSVESGEREKERNKRKNKSQQLSMSSCDLTPRLTAEIVENY
ncbi:hypothetical protein KR215_011456, partial [Drosophila sulfurigaster]